MGHGPSILDTGGRRENDGELAIPRGEGTRGPDQVTTGQARPRGRGEVERDASGPVLEVGAMAGVGEAERGGEHALHDDARPEHRVPDLRDGRRPLGGLGGRRTGRLGGGLGRRKFGSGSASAARWAAGVGSLRWAPASAARWARASEAQWPQAWVAPSVQVSGAPLASPWARGSASAAGRHDAHRAPVAAATTCRPGCRWYPARSGHHRRATARAMRRQAGRCRACPRPTRWRRCPTRANRPHHHRGPGGRCCHRQQRDHPTMSGPRGSHTRLPR